MNSRCGGLLWWGLLSLILAPASSGDQPNIVIILADDLGYGDPGCYNDQSRIPTPRIDRLAVDGMRFTDAHSPSSVCTPARYGLLTGRYAWRTRLQRGVLWPWDPPLLESRRTTLPEILRQSGYATACVGKWHLGWDWPLVEGGRIRDEFPGFTIPGEQRASWAERIDFSRPVDGGPLDHGFDHYFGDDVPNFPPYTFIRDRQVAQIPNATKPDSMFGHPGPAHADWDLAAVLPRITDRAVAFIEEQGERDSSRPFFLFFSLTAPHTPIAPAAGFAGVSQAGAYGDYVAQVDHSVGRIVDALHRSGVTERTLLVFTSDNGSPQRDGTGMSGPIGSVKQRFGHDPSRPWRGMKGDIWEAGHRVPLLVRWPQQIEAGTVSAQPVIHVDWMRTLATLTGQTLDGETGEDSFDLSPTLFGWPTRTAVRDHLIHHSGNGTFAIRQGPWKLITGRGSGGFTRYSPPDDSPRGQLYHLDEDPGEQTNRYASQPRRVDQLSRLLDQYRTARGTHPAADR